MSSTDSSADDHAYFQAIEESFIRLRGAPLLLSPSDWQLAKQWHRQGIPVQVVLETLEQIFAARQARGTKGRVQGLRYCAAAIEKAWEERRELLATGQRQEAAPIDVAARVHHLSGLLTTSQGVPGDLAARVAALSGTPETVESALLGLDREMIDRAAENLDATSLEEIRDSIAQSLTKLQSRLDVTETSRVSERLWREGIRRRLRLPVLSLFAASPPEE